MLNHAKDQITFDTHSPFLS